jgi:hypothetical protein
MTNPDDRNLCRSSSPEPRPNTRRDLRLRAGAPAFGMALVKAKGTVRLFEDDATGTRRITLEYLSGAEAQRTAEMRASMPRLVIEPRRDKRVGLAAH